MSSEWRGRSSSLAWSNPLAWWWGLLTLVSGANIAVWFLLYRQFHGQPTGSARLASSSCSSSVRPMFLAAHSGLSFRARMFSGSACSTRGCRALSSAAR